MGRPASDVREQIVTAAVELLRSQGVRAVVQTRVADAAGVPQGHLTYYFPKKSDLLVAVARRFREDTAKEAVRFFGPSRSQTGTREERLLGVVRTMAEDRERTRALVGLMLESERHPSLRDELLIGVREIQQFLASVLGKSEPDGDVDVLLAMYWGLGIQNLVLGDARTAKERQALLGRAQTLIESLIRT